jgi:hypothetical protein
VKQYSRFVIVTTADHQRPVSLAARTTDLRKAYLAAVSPEQRKGIEEMTDTQMVGSAFNHCGSHLVVAADRLAEKNKKKR